MSRWRRIAGLAGAPLAVAVVTLVGCATSTGPSGGAYGLDEPAMATSPSAPAANGGRHGPEQPSLVPPETPAASAPGRILGDTTPVSAYSAPSTGAAVVGRFSDGDVVSIVCTARGDQVTAGGFVSDLWDRISGGGFLPDVQVDTGSDDPAMPACSG
jgi:hypothetical protein